MNPLVQERLSAELRNIRDHLTRSAVSEEWVRSVGILDASVEQSGVELAHEAGNTRSPAVRRPTRNTRSSFYGDRELVDMKHCSRRQSVLR